MTSTAATPSLPPKKSFGKKLLRDLVTNKYIYLMLVPVIAYYIIFSYIPMYGILMAFENYNPRMGILGSEWVGLAHFRDFFASTYFVRLIRNTLLINIYELIFGFPAPIIFALLLNELPGKLFKKYVQTASYLPYFVSVMIICGLLRSFCASYGLFNNIGALFGLQRADLLAKPELFRTIYVASDIWQSVGFSSIIYISALTSVDPGLYEAATIDGASRFRKIISISLPSIMPTITILLILNIGSLMSLGYEKIILLYNSITYETADVISSFVYRRGIVNGDYSFGTAVGLFNTLVNFILIIIANTIANRVSDTSLF